MANAWRIHAVDAVSAATELSVSSRKKRDRWAGLGTVAMGYSAQCNLLSFFFLFCLFSLHFILVLVKFTPSI